MDKINKLSLPATILIASFVIGGFYYAGEVNKQKSIERQQEMKITNDRRAEEEKKRELENCLEEAKKRRDEERNGYCKLDKREIREDGGCYLSKVRVEYLNERYDEARDVCFKKYQQK